MRAVIFAGGAFSGEFSRREDDFIICADRGCLHVQRLGIVPDVVIGDFDSFPEENVRYAKEKIVLPREKDRTDTHECVLYAIRSGAAEILLLGATGTRLDHTLANLHLLKVALDAGIPMKIADEHNEIFLVRGSASIPRKEGRHLSLLPIGTAEGISLSGVYYPLADAKMTFGEPYGVSNEFTAETAEVSVEKGMLLAILSKD